LLDDRAPHGGEETAAIAALLRDVVEDGGGVRALAEIDERLGTDVAAIVEDCSDTTAKHTEDKTPRKTREVPRLGVHLVLDNGSTHKTPAIKRWLAARPRSILHFTPTSSAWLNLVERWVRRTDDEDSQARRTPLRPRAQRRDPAWIDTCNDDPPPFGSTKTADQILDSIARHGERINESRH